MQDTNRRKLHRWSLVLLIVLTCVGCDQATKAIARETLVHTPPISLLNGILHLEYAENLGAFLGMGAQTARLGLGQTQPALVQLRHQYIGELLDHQPGDSVGSAVEDAAGSCVGIGQQCPAIGQGALEVLG